MCNATGAEEVYVIEVKNKVDGVETEIDLYYSKDGVLVKKLVDADNDYDYGDYIPAAPVEGVEAFLKANFPMPVSWTSTGRTT